MTTIFSRNLIIRDTPLESSGRQLSKSTKYAIVHALLGKKVRYQAVK